MKALLRLIAKPGQLPETPAPVAPSAPRACDLGAPEIQAVLDRVKARAAGANRTLDLAWIDGVAVREDVTQAFLDAGGVCLAPAGAKLPVIEVDQTLGKLDCPIVLIGPNVRIDYVMVSGESPMVIAPNYTNFCGNIYCSGSSLVFIGDTTFTGNNAKIDARNGGTVWIDGDALWSTDITIYTDDMHAIRDVETGKRINEFGGTVEVGRHVWLSRDVLLLPGTKIGSDCVIGARAVVKATIPPNSIAAGVPAKVVRQGITWTRDDLP